MWFLWVIIGVLLVVWVIGLLFALFEPILNILLIAAAVLFVLNMFLSRRRRV